MSIDVTAPADGGNIEVLDASNAAQIRLAIRPDGAAKFHQWFHFRVSGAKGTPLTLRIENCGDSSYARGWPNYRAVMSTDGTEWRRVDTAYEDGVLTITHTPASDSVRFAYFAPFGLSEQQAMIERACAAPRTTLTTLGHTIDGEPLDLLTIGEPAEGKARLWFIARQHPGETMASFWMEGFLQKLCDEADAEAKTLLDKAVVYAVPLMNPDGARRGHLRTNAAGTDLNRAWAEPSMDKSPEVFLVRQKMEETGLDFFFDVHGDEVIPNNFVAGAEGIPGWSDRLQSLQDRFKKEMVDRTPDFQTQEGYPIPPAGKANMALATSWTAQTFDALALTLEMPFKDALSNPDEVYGWSPERCRQLGRDCLGVMAGMVEELR
ncbi:M14 family metallopeptidase [Parvularcula dongshanensis]|uniref:Murein tripeptide amidase MpaA n=1 Tax=Parvularcula dongshanensis TaxID=1173995 RepID=A0A840I2N5_9PROT|nr:carboxypeptidase family protein [Parvularcula dongshanensis]MBB4659266.1 murein tripeptide amidase MpaA [Parvularcula dongshanensis]